MNLRESEFLRLEVHFPGDAGGLWRRLDKDHSGTITLSELAPKSADEVAARDRKRTQNRARADHTANLSGPLIGCIEADVTCKLSFCSIFQDIQDFGTPAPRQSQHSILRTLAMNAA